jgi:hypothetical protein
MIHIRIVKTIVCKNFPAYRYIFQKFAVHFYHSMQRVFPASTSSSPSEVGVGSAKDGGAKLYGCFSPRVGDYLSLSTLSSVPSTAEGEAIATVVAPVVQIMPELRELCTSPTLPLSVEHKKMDSPTTLSSPERSDEVFAPIPPSMLDNPDALFAKELCDILSSLEVACLLTGTPIKGKSKVSVCPRTGKRKEKSLRPKGTAPAA